MNPYILKTTPRYVIIDYKANDEIINFLKKINIKVIKTIKCNELQEPIDGHPDMVIHPIDYKNFIVAPNVYSYYYDILSNIGIKVIKGGKTLCRNYPEDIAYNVARIGRFAVHNIKHTDHVLKYYLDMLGIEFIHVNQGYSKCSLTSVAENKCITSDILIHDTLKSNNIDCMYIDPQIISLKGYNNGFIGGSTGLINDKIFLSTGRISDDSIVDSLKKFIQSSNCIYAEASSENIMDLGTVIPII